LVTVQQRFPSSTNENLQRSLQKAQTDQWLVSLCHFYKITPKKILAYTVQ